MNLDGLLYEHRLFIDSHYEELAGFFCNLTGQRTTLTKDRYLLSNWYEGYLYTLLLGIRKNQREPYKGKRLDKAPKWSNNYIKQYKYALSLILSRKDILNELNLIDYQSINLEDRNLENIMDDVKKICDEFSNGGLLHLSRLYEKDNTIFNEYDGLTKIMNKAIGGES
jgi:hypothetical protein